MTEVHLTSNTRPGSNRRVMSDMYVTIREKGKYIYIYPNDDVLEILKKKSINAYLDVDKMVMRIEEALNGSGSSYRDTPKDQRPHWSVSIGNVGVIKADGGSRRCRIEDPVINKDGSCKFHLPASWSIRKK